MPDEDDVDRRPDGDDEQQDRHDDADGAPDGDVVDGGHAEPVARDARA